MTTLCFLLSNAKAKGNAKAKDATFARSLTKAREAKDEKGAPFAFALLQSKAKEGQPLLLAMHLCFLLSTFAL